MMNGRSAEFEISSLTLLSRAREVSQKSKRERQKVD
jgi:hypothetical protein